MADFSNRQLAEIITQTSENIQSNVLKQRNIATDLEKTESKLSTTIDSINSKIDKLNQTEIKPDLSHLNKFYEEKTAENIKRVNSRLSVPNLAVYIWLSSVGLFLLSGLFLWFSTKSKQDIISNYQDELLKENAVLPREEKVLYEDMREWFKLNPKTKDIFVDWRSKKK